MSSNDADSVISKVNIINYLFLAVPWLFVSFSSISKISGDLIDEPVLQAHAHMSSTVGSVVLNSLPLDISPKSEGYSGIV